jgi:uncharacterized membrane protein YphA (DoxX/SURF4 family)
VDTNRYIGIVFLLGRALVGGVYLQAGISNILYRPAKSGYAASKGLIAADVLVVIAGALLIVAGLCILTGFRPRIGILALTLFLIPVTLVMHNFWAAEGVMREVESHAFLGNVAMLGSAFVFIAIPQPWPYSLDEWLATRRSATRPADKVRPVATT